MSKYLHLIIIITALRTGTKPKFKFLSSRGIINITTNRKTRKYYTIIGTYMAACNKVYMPK